MADADQRYNFICPNCSGSFSIQIDRIPPVQARFRCPHCKQPMDFLSRDEARRHIRLQSEGGANAVAGKALARGGPGDTPPPTAAAVPEGSSPIEGVRFRVDKPGFQSDVFDRRGVRNLIRTREVLETDLVLVDDLEAVPAAEVPYLKSLFSLARAQKTQPPPCCRTHTDSVAFFRCHDSGRPLCEECAPEKKFGGSTLRVCQHCGGTAEDIVLA